MADRNNNNNSSMISADACLPQVITDFIFDLFDSVTLSQLEQEQQVLYKTTLPDLCQKYFTSKDSNNNSNAWPSMTSIAKECNGDPLFLAIYRELSHRHWHSQHRPTLADRMEGWEVYVELFDEILEVESNNDFYLLPSWVFEILHEFVYQFQGYCQIRTAVLAAAQKHQLVDDDGNLNTSNIPNKHSNLAENLAILQNNPDTWDVEQVYGYLFRLVQMGLPSTNTNTNKSSSPVAMYFSIFASIALSRLECLLGDYTGCLQALDVIAENRYVVIPPTKAATTLPEEDSSAGAALTGTTWTDVVQSVLASKVSLSYHAGIAYLQLRRYQDAARILADCAGALSRGFKTGALNTRGSNTGRDSNKGDNKSSSAPVVDNDQFPKQYDRILSLLAILQQICPGFSNTDPEGEAVIRAIRDKHGNKIQAATHLEEWFQSPKFISASSELTTTTAAGSSSSNQQFYYSMHRQQIDMFNAEMKFTLYGRTLRSYLKLYTSLPVQKLAAFQDLEMSDFLPLLLSYKYRMRQLERDPTGHANTYSGGTMQSTALDIHYHVDETDTVHIDEAEIQRRFETYFAGQILQNCDIRNDAMAIDTTI